ncbi:MAG TPA: HAMP domain-containing sensor histidine kinase, partial [Candidatus Kapabacteria bacterium]|nr:HAMP domain-containing sensor histidine kinase [Candidatus Kapabacteria bacterium]
LLRDYRIYNHKKAKSTPVEVSFAPVKDVDSENEKFFVGVIRDITAQEEMNRLRDDFIATLTHDLRTPLLAAIQTLGFFLDGSLGELNDRQKLLLETMLHSNQDMLGLVNALLEVYKYESGKLVLCKDNFELNQLIYQCVDEVQSLIQKKEISLSVNTDEDVKVNADKQELRRVLSNLLGNAINYTESGGKINISVTQDSENVLISVEDNGIGIPKEDIPHIFKRFSQGTSKKRSTGTGLGLYLSRQIVEAHDGKIWLESEVGKGSKFYFTIPKLKTVVTTGLKN